jgi:hypothetical protein
MSPRPDSRGSVQTPASGGQDRRAETAESLAGLAFLCPPLGEAIEPKGAVGNLPQCGIVVPDDLNLPLVKDRRVDATPFSLEVAACEVLLNVASSSISAMQP